MSENRPTDHELIAATKDGDESAFEEIMRRYSSPITNYLYRFLNDREEAVDLAQETFVRVYYAIDRYNTEYAFSTYIYRIATNLAITETRKRKRRKLLSLTGLFQSDADEAKEYEIADEGRLQDEGFEADERGKIIESAIASLPEKYRMPIILRDVQEHSYDEVAEILGLGLGTTKSRISRARGLLRAKLEGHFPELE